jgi:hypothetical protein
VAVTFIILSFFPNSLQINVGPHGDYDHRWVRPGQKLFDVRGKLFRNGTLMNTVSGVSTERSGGTHSVLKKKQLLSSPPQSQPSLRVGRIDNLSPATSNYLQLGENLGTFEEVERFVLKKANNHVQTNKNKIKSLKRKFPSSNAGNE